MSKVEQILKLDKQLLDFVDDEIKLKIRRLENVFQYSNLFLFTKSTKTFRAMLLLGENGFGEDCAVLARSVLENLIALSYIKKDNSKTRAKLFALFPLYNKKKKVENIDEKDLLEEFRKKLDDKKTREYLDELIKLRKQEEHRIKNDTSYGFKKSSWAGISIKDMAIETGFEDLYYEKIYWLICQFSHPDISSFKNYRTINNNGIKINDIASDSWVKSSLILGFDCYFRIVDITNDNFNLAKEDDMKTLMNEYLAIFSDKS